MNYIEVKGLKERLLAIKTQKRILVNCCFEEFAKTHRLNNNNISFNKRVETLLAYYKDKKIWEIKFLIAQEHKVVKTLSEMSTYEEDLTQTN